MLAITQVGKSAMVNEKSWVVSCKKSADIRCLSDIGGKRYDSSSSVIASFISSLPNPLRDK
jgi:hypothetical protein